MLTRFAGSLLDQDVLPPGADAAQETVRYLRYHHGLEAAEWREVEQFARDNRAELEGADIDARTGRFAEPEYGLELRREVSRDGTGFDASSVGQQWRLLFGFAAQYTFHAAGIAEDALRRSHNLGEAEGEQWEVGTGRSVPGRSGTLSRHRCG